MDTDLKADDWRWVVGSTEDRREAHRQAVPQGHTNNCRGAMARCLVRG
jgi:hypothetical protein